MLLEEKKVSIQASHMKDTVDFRAKLDGMMFDNLINGIYSNKIGAGIREYATNARDGHARRGNLTEPFEVGLPTRDKAFFEVRDFGSSLTHQEVFDVFAVLGESTKRDTNDETGCLGLGSKSAFAYTNTFTVTCWKDGEKRDYSCYIGEAGQPKVSLIHTIKSHEREGVRVAYAVKQGDINDFNKEASKQLRGFDPQPNIIRKNEFYKPLLKENLVLEGDGWQIFKPVIEPHQYRATAKPMAIQGSVAYPIDCNNASLLTALRNECGTASESVRKMIQSTDIIMRFDIGELRMTTSREELAYDERTCKNIAQKALKVFKSIQDKLDEEYKSCKNLREARIMRAKNKSGNINEIERTLGITKRFWNGQEIKADIKIADLNGEIGELKGDQVFSSWQLQNYQKKNELVKSHKGGFRLINDFNYRNKFGEFKAQFQWPDRTNKNARMLTERPCNEVNNMVVLVDVESLHADKNTNNLMRHFWKNTLASIIKKNGRLEQFMWLKTDTLAEAEAFLESIYHDLNDNVFYLHKMSELKMPSKAKVGSTVQPNATNPDERKIRYLIGTNYYYTSQTANYEIIDFSKNPKIPTVFFKNNNFYLTKKAMDDEDDPFSYQEITRLVWNWAGGEKFYIVNGQHMKFYEDNPKYFKDLKSWLISEYETKNPNWKQEYAASTYKDDDSDNQELKDYFSLLRKNHNIRFKSIDKELDGYVKSNAYKPSRRRFSQPNYFGNWMEKEMKDAIQQYPQQSQKTVFADLAKQHPVLDYLVRRTSYYRNDEDFLAAIKQVKLLINE